MQSCLNPLLPLAVLVLAGCSTFQPTTLESIPLGTDIRVELTEAGEAQVEPYIGRESSEVIEGTLLRADPDSVIFESWRADMVTSQDFRAGRIRVSLATSEVVSVERKSLAVVKTAGFFTVLLGGGYLLVTEAFSGSQGGTDKGGGGPIILLSLLLRGGR